MCIRDRRCAPGLAQFQGGLQIEARARSAPRQVIRAAEGAERSKGGEWTFSAALITGTAVPQEDPRDLCIWRAGGADRGGPVARQPSRREPLRAQGGRQTFPGTGSCRKSYVLLWATLSC
eukprot:11969384-Alexandrium_andersonii.AAC.1